jgi:hypothetical protein
MRAAVIIHGPEAVDTGLSLQVIEALRGRYEVRAVMSGYTGVAAVVDAGLEGVIDIREHHVPSVTIKKMAEESDLIVLVNSAKDETSALRFGGIVSARAKEVKRPLVQVDEMMVLPWNDSMLEAVLLAEALDRPMIVPHISGEDEVEGWRRIGGVRIGENVWVNGVVVGKATSEDVWIACEQGRLAAKGIVLKETGVRRLGAFLPASAHVRSGVTRRTTARPRQLRAKNGPGRLIDHSAERAIMTCREAGYVVTIGDDTSRAAASLLYRFGVKVLAITDGDEDGICREDLAAEGSVEMRMVPGTDDIVGAEVRDAVFQGGDRSDLPFPEMARRVCAIAGDRLLSVRERKH